MRQHDPHQPTPPRIARRPLTIREKVDRELRPVVRRALLGDAPLPTRRWENVSRGRTGATAREVECAIEARKYAHRTPAQIRAGLHTIADAKADAIEHHLREAA